MLSSTDIWIGMDGSQVVHWNGEGQSQPICTPISINKLCSSSNDLYAVGYGGGIAHYNGTSWSKIESGTTTTINDIWGVNDVLNGERLILVPSLTCLTLVTIRF
ncbi:MAG: hypothetical protein MZV64_61415 [Ignavibacteriales bacterium]|nr:hypothetical protein [Ignavibacteriales bacterium]